MAQGQRARELFAITDREALEAFALTARLEGIIPALESAHAVAWAVANGPSELIWFACRDGGTKTSPSSQPARAIVSAVELAGASSIGSFAGAKLRGRMTGIERIAEAFESARANGRRAALCPT